MWGTHVSEVDGRYLLLSVRRDTSRVRTALYSSHGSCLTLVASLFVTEKPFVDRGPREGHDWAEFGVGQGYQRL